ncbi:MAG: ORF6N domain-containing protein [Burkholderiales bacterium]|nr:ORF6N domain-containing protein [Bacteroidia bacterium]
MNEIYLIRNQKVIFDIDLAELYPITTDNLNNADYRNIKRFPEDFMFQLIEPELKNLMLHNAISSERRNRKYLIYQTRCNYILPKFEWQ